MTRFAIRDLLYVTVIAALAAAWWVANARRESDVARLETQVKQLKVEVKRLADGPSWGGMDRIMDQFYEHWKELQLREKALGLAPTPFPPDLLQGVRTDLTE